MFYNVSRLRIDKSGVYEDCITVAKIIISVRIFYEWFPILIYELIGMEWITYKYLYYLQL